MSRRKESNSINMESQNFWSPNESRSGRSPPISAEEWEEHHDRIQELYMDRNLTLTKVKAELGKPEVGFFPSRRQLTAQLKRWGMGKYKPRKKTPPTPPPPPSPSSSLLGTGKQFPDPIEAEGTYTLDIDGDGDQSSSFVSFYLQRFPGSEMHPGANSNAAMPYDRPELALHDPNMESFDNDHGANQQQALASMQSPGHGDISGPSFQRCSHSAENQTSGDWVNVQRNHYVSPTLSRDPREMMGLEGIDEDLSTWNMMYSQGQAEEYSSFHSHESSQRLPHSQLQDNNPHWEVSLEPTTPLEEPESSS